MPSPSIENKVIKRVLANGLTVLLKEDHSNPVAAINMWFKVGSVNETEELTGLAHFQEHMVFKGTEKHGVGEIAHLIKSAGGNLNAGTSYSYTMYHVVLPSRAFKLGLELQADAMMNSTFDEEEFDKERLVVIDEARMYDDTPDAYTFYRTMELGFEVHNYRRPIAGYEEVVKNIGRDQLLDFYRKYYRPSNAVLVVVGDVDPGVAVAEIEKVYGSWGGERPEIHESPAEPPQEKFRFKAFRGPLDHAYLGIGYHVTSILDEDYPALEMISTLLDFGKSSRLYRNVLDEKHLVTTIASEVLAEKWPGYFMIFASTPGEKWEEARDAIFEEVERFKVEPVGAEELLKARRQIQKSMYTELETMEGQASNLGYYEVMGDYRLAEKHRAAISKVTPDQITAAARKYLTLDNCSLVSYLPGDRGIGEPSEADVEAAVAQNIETVGRAFRGKIPPRAGARDKDVKPRKKTRGGAEGKSGGRGAPNLLRLDNGLRVLVKRRTTVPLVTMLAVVEGGTRLEPKGKSGLSILAFRTLLKGTKSYPANDIVNRIESMGGSVDCFSSFDAAGVYVNVLADHLDSVAQVYKEIIREPQFSPKQVEKEKSKLMKELAKRHDNPILYSIDNLFAHVFGDHPYSHPFLGDESQLKALSEKDCSDWYRRVLVPENIVAVFVGDITEEHAMELAERVFGDLKGGPAPTAELEAPRVPVDPGTHELRRTNLKQAVGLVGFNSPAMMSDDAIALEVLNGILTGLGGRLFVELRDKRSLGYMAGSSFVPLKDRSIFFAYSNPGPDGIGEAIDVIMDELDKVTRETVRSSELTRSKEWLMGTQVMRLQRNFSQAVAYGTYEALGFGYDVVDRTPDIIQGVTPERIIKAAAGLFHREGAVCIKLLPESRPDSAKE